MVPKRSLCGCLAVPMWPSGGPYTVSKQPLWGPWVEQSLTGDFRPPVLTQITFSCYSAKSITYSIGMICMLVQWRCPSWRVVMRRQASRWRRHAGSILLKATCFAKSAIAWHKLIEFFPYNILNKWYVWKSLNQLWWDLLIFVCLLWHFEPVLQIFLQRSLVLEHLW